jgi:predicted transcriptional regulator
VLKPFATKLHEETLSKLDELARKSRIPKSRLCEQAIELLVEHYRQLDHDLQTGKKIRETERLQPV